MSENLRKIFGTLRKIKENTWNFLEFWHIFFEILRKIFRNFKFEVNFSKFKKKSLKIFEKIEIFPHLPNYTFNNE